MLFRQNKFIISKRRLNQLIEFLNTWVCHFQKFCTHQHNILILLNLFALIVIKIWLLTRQVHLVSASLDMSRLILANPVHNALLAPLLTLKLHNAFLLIPL